MATKNINQFFSENPMLNIALLQMLPVEFDIQKNIDIGSAFCRKAAKEGADLAVFPEMFSIGYPTPHNDNNSFEIWHQVAFKGQKPISQDEIQKYRSYAIDDDHKYISHFRALAKELKMAIAITYMAKGIKAPRNTVLVIDQTGKDVLKYSKTHLFQPFVIDAICEPGGEFPVTTLNTKNGSVCLGALICADRNVPEPARILMKKGAELVIIPNACPLKGLGGRILNSIETRAYENAMAIATCNYPEPKTDGYSTAFDVFGSVVTKANEKEGIVVAKYDLNKIRSMRAMSPEGDAFREECFYGEILGGPKPKVFSDRLTAIGEMPQQYNRSATFATQ